MNNLWQKIQILRNKLIELNILHTKPKNPDRLMRSFDWKSKCSEELLNEIDECVTYFQNENEFWYCISYDLNPFTEDFICPICKKERLKFVGRKGSKFNNAYNSTCKNCSANSLPEKKDKQREAIAKQTDEKRAIINEKRRQTLLERFGDENYSLYGSDSFKANMEEKYGDPYYNNREKAMATTIEHYGVDCIFKLESFREQAMNTKIEKYGCGQNLEKLKATNNEKFGQDYYVTTDEFKEKAKATTIEKFGSLEASYQHRKTMSEATKFIKYEDINYNNSEQSKLTRKTRKETFAEENDCTPVQELIAQFGQGWLCLKLPRLYNKKVAFIENKNIPQIETYFNSNKVNKSVSKMEIEMQDYIRTFGYKDLVCNTKLVVPHYELDAYIPSKNLAFEFNGIYWHSLKAGKDPNYHRDKTEACEKLGITLIHIFEDVWNVDRAFCELVISNAINNVQLGFNVFDRCYYYPQKGYKVVKTTEPQAFYCKGYKRTYVTDENIQDLMDAGYLVCYDCGRIFLEKE